MLKLRLKSKEKISKKEYPLNLEEPKKEFGTFQNRTHVHVYGPLPLRNLGYAS